MCKALALTCVPKIREEKVAKDLYAIWGEEHTVQQIVDIALKEKKNFKTDAKIYIENLPIPLDNFILSWRLHFVETMKPQFLPNEWSINFKTHN